MKVMNKKGFTLVELLAVISLLALLAGIAVPNVISTINNNKRNTFLQDAKRLVTRAEYLISSDKEVRNKLINNSISQKTYSFSELNEKGEFSSDPDSGGETYQDGSVKVTYDPASKTFKYCVYLNGIKRQVGTSSSCIDSNNLTGISVVKDK